MPIINPLKCYIAPPKSEISSAHNLDPNTFIDTLAQKISEISGENQTTVKTKL